jgi:hypothetical protein
MVQNQGAQEIKCVREREREREREKCGRKKHIVFIDEIFRE